MRHDSSSPPRLGRVAAPLALALALTACSEGDVALDDLPLGGSSADYVFLGPSVSDPAAWLGAGLRPLGPGQGSSYGLRPTPSLPRDPDALAFLADECGSEPEALHPRLDALRRSVDDTLALMQVEAGSAMSPVAAEAALRAGWAFLRPLCPGPAGHEAIDATVSKHFAAGTDAQREAARIKWGELCRRGTGHEGLESWGVSDDRFFGLFSTEDSLTAATSLPVGSLSSGLERTSLRLVAAQHVGYHRLPERDQRCLSTLYALTWSGNERPLVQVVALALGASYQAQVRFAALQVGAGATAVNGAGAVSLSFKKASLGSRGSMRGEFEEAGLREVFASAHQRSGGDNVRALLAAMDKSRVRRAAVVGALVKRIDYELIDRRFARFQRERQAAGERRDCDGVWLTLVQEVARAWFLHLGELSLQLGEAAINRLCGDEGAPVACDRDELATLLGQTPRELMNERPERVTSALRHFIEASTRGLFVPDSQDVRSLFDAGPGFFLRWGATPLGEIPARMGPSAELVRELASWVEKTSRRREATVSSLEVVVGLAKKTPVQSLLEGLRMSWRQARSLGCRFSGELEDIVEAVSWDEAAGHILTRATAYISRMGQSQPLGAETPRSLCLREGLARRWVVVPSRRADCLALGEAPASLDSMVSAFVSELMARSRIVTETPRR